MASGGGTEDGDGGGRSGGGGGRFVRQVLFGPRFNMGSIDLDSDEVRESMDLALGPDQDAAPEPEQEAFSAQPESSSAQLQLATASQLSEDPLSHYVSDGGQTGQSQMEHLL